MHSPLEQSLVGISRPLSSARTKLGKKVHDRNQKVHGNASHTQKVRTHMTTETWVGPTGAGSSAPLRTAAPATVAAIAAQYLS
eukprot:6116797-Pleurochrysis_carterae.AAC.2